MIKGLRVGSAVNRLKDLHITIFSIQTLILSFLAASSILPMVSRVEEFRWQSRNAKSVFSAGPSSGSGATIEIRNLALLSREETPPVNEVLKSM